MLNVQQFRYAADNLSYLVYGSKEALVIDGGAYREILDFTGKENLKLIGVSLTHRHPDHMIGRRELLEETGAGFFTDRDLLDGPGLAVDGKILEVFPTPGHSADSLTFYTGDALITGDTLFVGTVGNCFTGDYRAFFDSLKKLIAFPPETIVYPGHDYVRYALNVAREIDPDNAAVDVALQRYNPYHVFSTIAGELQINPFVRFDDPKMAEILKRKGLPAASSYERFRSLMTLH